jgi:hypothetical protein
MELLAAGGEDGDMTAILPDRLALAGVGIPAQRVAGGWPDTPQGVL